MVMDVACDLEVDVNGEETFIVDKKIISSYSGRVSNLFCKTIGTRQKLKVIFHDFPGGARNFELAARFCYNNGKIEINPSNVSQLYCVSHFMEMNKSVSGTINLFERTEKSLEEIRFWTWSELLVALKQCQDLLPISNASGILQKCLDSLTGRIALACETSPCPSTSSADSSGFRFSCDSRSTESLRNSLFRATWWFEDLLALCPELVEMMIKLLVSRKFDHGVISKFLFYYQKSRILAATSDEKCKITETVIKALHSLDQNAISYKSLFGILRVALSLDITKCCRNMLESMIGSQLDQAILDDLLIPPPSKTNCLYDVNLVLQFLKSFTSRGVCHVSLPRLKKVARLMDMYIAEVAPDPRLKPSKFLALVRALPDAARDSYDGIYRAMDMYLEVHAGLSEEETMSICYTLNYKKLSSEVYSHLSHNSKFPSKIATLLHETGQPNSNFNFPCNSVEIDSKGKKDEGCEQIVLYAGRLDISAESQNLQAQLQGMQWRVQELERVCRKMQTQMTKIMKSRLSSHSNARSLPRLCS